MNANCSHTSDKPHVHARDGGVCCPLHAAVGMAVPSASLPDNGEPVSLLDMTPKQPSALCTDDRSATAGLYETVVRILTGTDFPNPFVIEGFALHDEFQMLVDGAGMTTAEVLHATTRQAAIYHGDSAADGYVAKGGVADLVVLEGDPLVDITATQTIETVLVNGRTLLRRAGIEEGLARIQRCFAAMPPAIIQMPGEGENSYA